MSFNFNKNKQIIILSIGVLGSLLVGGTGFYTSAEAKINNELIDEKIENSALQHESSDNPHPIISQSYNEMKTHLTILTESVNKLSDESVKIKDMNKLHDKMDKLSDSIYKISEYQHGLKILLCTHDAYQCDL